MLKRFNDALLFSRIYPWYLKLYCYWLGIKDICNKIYEILTPPHYLDIFLKTCKQVIQTKGAVTQVFFKITNLSSRFKRETKA